MLRRAVSVELVGLPGSGKTTLHQPLTRSLAKHGVVVDGYRLSRSLGRQPRAWLAALPSFAWRVGARGAHWSLNRDGRVLLDDCLRQHIAVELSTGRGADFCLFQEGATHTAWRLHFDGRLPLCAASVGQLLRLVDVVVMLDVSAERARARIRSKTQLGRINRLLAEDPLDGPCWRRAIEGYERIRASSAHEARVVVVDNERDELGDDVVARAVGAVTATVGSRAAKKH